MQQVSITSYRSFRLEIISMLFNSFSFALFLPIVFICYWFIFARTLRWQNLFIVVASYVFYGWWDWRFLLLIALTSFCSWGSGLLIKRANDTSKTGGGIFGKKDQKRHIFGYGQTLFSILAY